MKCSTLLFGLIVIISSSCNKEVTTHHSLIDKTKILGYWYPVPGDYGFDPYDSYYYGNDSTYIQDGSSVGLGVAIGKWYWINDSTVKVIIITGPGSVGVGNGTANCIIRHVSDDSLFCIFPIASNSIVVKFHH